MRIPCRYDILKQHSFLAIPFWLEVYPRILNILRMSTVSYSTYQPNLSSPSSTYCFDLTIKRTGEKKTNIKPAVY